MPLGVERINARKSQPNANIVFIKPLKGPDEQIAQDFLERIAAQCLPIMREHHLYVMSLEEFPSNREFVGRNFNAGEVVQLVLKSPSTGRWLPFRYVQMVMMHELAHCKQMNHSRAFWAVRNSYAAQMQVLWSRGYTGDGIWGRGTKLATGLWEGNTVGEGEVLPEHLCGGTFSSRKGGVKRRTKKPALTYQEQKQRRIEKKFGKNGTVLGADDDVKSKLERGKQVKGKPRVAGSARGRELRAAAALARFEPVKKEEASLPVKSEHDEEGSWSESEYEYDEEANLTSAVDIDGSPLVDGKGRGLIKVCGDEDSEGPEAKDEMSDLRNVFKAIKQEPVDDSHSFLDDFKVGLDRGMSKPKSPLDGCDSAAEPFPSLQIKTELSDLEFEARPKAGAPGKPLMKEEPPMLNGTLSLAKKLPSQDLDARGRDNIKLKKAVETSSTAQHDISSPNAGPSASHDDLLLACSMCSFVNTPMDVTCNICANVLNPKVIKDSWQCSNSLCRRDGSMYWNSADCGVCGICGHSRSRV